MPKRTRISKTHGAIAAMVVGTFFVVTQGAAITNAIASRSWPETTGTVTSSRVEWLGRRSYQPVIRYRYVVGGEKYKARRYKFGGFFSSSKLERLFGLEPPVIKKHPRGSAIVVKYHPRKPSKATIKSTVPLTSFLGMALGGFLFSCGVTTLRSRKYQKKKRGKKSKRKPKKSTAWAT